VDRCEPSRFSRCVGDLLLEKHANAEGNYSHEHHEKERQYERELNERLPHRRRRFSRH
jgi:hypothetical protein